MPYKRLSRFSGHFNIPQILAVREKTGGVYVKFQVCNGTNDFILNLGSTKSPVRYLNLDFSVQLAPADTADGGVDLTGKQIHQQGQQINEMANTSLYSNGQFVTCSGMSLKPLSSTVSGGNAWFKPTTIYDPVVPDCNGGTAQDPCQSADQHFPGARATGRRLHLDGVAAAGQYRAWYRIGVAETVTVKRTSTSVAGGQYQMPFSYKIQKLNCTP
jgi:hypothetical protein